MAEVLSQAEIDALLSSVSGEEKAEKEEEGIRKKEVPKKSIRVYDFSSPDKFSKDQIRTLQMLHEGFTRLLNSSLSAHLRTVVQVGLASVMEQSYEEFIRSVSSPTMIGVFRLPPLEGSAILEMNPVVVHTMIDRLLGGTGEVEEEVKELTDIEQGVVEGIILRILNNFKDAWANITNFNPRLDTLETNPAFAQIVAPNDRVACIALEIKIGEMSGIINICVPHILLEPVLPKLSAQLWFSGAYKGTTKESIALLEKRLGTALVPLIAELGNTQVPLKDVLSLQTGDVIRLDTAVGDKLKIKVGEYTKFYGQAGTMRGKVSVQITSKAG